MANEVSQSSVVERIENKNWKNRCIELLKQVEKRNLSAKGETEGSSVLLKERNETEEKLKAIEDKVADAMKQLNEIVIEKGDKLTNSSVLSLYELITKLTFDIESPPNEVKGFVAGKSLEAFQFDISQHSKQLIIDHLWYLINLQLKEEKGNDLSRIKRTLQQTTFLQTDSCYASKKIFTDYDLNARQQDKMSTSTSERTASSLLFH